MPAVEYVHCHKDYESTTTSDNSAAAPPVKELYHRRHFQRRVQRQRPQKLRRRRKFYRLEQPVSCPNYCIGSEGASNTSDDHSVCACVDQRRKRSTVPSVPAFRCFKICPSRSRPTHVCVPVYNQPEPPRLRLRSSGCRRSSMLHHPCCTQSRGMCSVMTASRHSGGVVIPDELQAQYDALMQHYALRNQGNSASRIKSSAKMGHPPKECPAERGPPTPDSGRTECRRRFACSCRTEQSSRQFLALTESLLACLDADSSAVSGKDRRQRPPETGAVEHDSLNEDRGPCRESEVFDTASKIVETNQRNCVCPKEAKEWNETRCSPFSNSEMFHYKTYEPNTASSNTKTLPDINLERFAPKIPCTAPSLTIQGMTEFGNDFSFLEQIVGSKNCGRVTTPTAHDDTNSAVFPVKQPKQLNIYSYQKDSINNVELDYHSKEDAKSYEKLNSVSRDNQPQEEQNENCVTHSASGTASNQTIIDTKQLAQRLKVPSSEHSSRLSVSPRRNESTFERDERIASWSRSSRSQVSNITKNLDGSTKTNATNSVYHEFEMEGNGLHIPDSADDTTSKISSKLTKKSSRDHSRLNSSRSRTSFKESISSMLFTGIDKLTETNEQAAKLIDRAVTAHLCDREKKSFVSNNYMCNPQSDATESGSRSISGAESFNRRSLPHSPVAQLLMSADRASEGPKFRKILKQMQLEHITHMENDLKRLKDIARSLDIITED